MGAWIRPLVIHLLSSMLLFSVDGGVARMLPHFRFRMRDVKMIEMEVVHVERRLQSAQYCVALPNADQAKLQDALDWACGSGSAMGNVDCSAIQQGGSCFSPNTLQGHASYAFDYYYVKENGASGSCDFNGLATTTTTDPSSGSCVYPSTASGVSSSTNATSSPTGGGGSPTPPTSGTSPTSNVTGSATGTLSWVQTWCALVVVLLLGSG